MVCLYYVNVYYFVNYLVAMGFLVDIFRIIPDLEYFCYTRGALVF